MTLRVQELNDHERVDVQRIARSHTLGAALVRRAQIVVYAMDGQGGGDRHPDGSVRQHGAPLAEPLQRAGIGWAGGGCAYRTAADLLGRAAQHRHHRRPNPPIRTGPAVCVVDPGPPSFLSVRAGHRHAPQPDQRDLHPRGPALAPGRNLVRCAGRSRLREKKGAIEQLYTAPPTGSVVICLDEMGPQKAKSHPGRQLVRPAGPKAERARQEIDYGRRGVAGYVFGAFQPASGKAFTQPYERRTTTNWVDFLSAVEAWIDPASERVYAVVDNLNTHSAPDVLLFSLLHPRWEFVFQPKYAAYLNLIEPWWKIMRSLALKGRRFETWAEIEEAVERATAYWNEHKHPFIWGRRRRHRMPRRLGLAAIPAVSRT